jgi:hypothetical protein
MELMLQHIEKKYGLHFIRVRDNSVNDGTLEFRVEDEREKFDYDSLFRFIKNYFPTFRNHNIYIRNISGEFVYNR